MDSVYGELTALLEAGGVTILSGAGLSTESGIPDYRGQTGAARRATPMTLQAFTGDPAARRRYWARSHLGWRTIARATPNAGHDAVAALQRAGLVTGIITQNVDGLHQAAGATEVTELHGSLDRVVCLHCGARSTRSELDRRLRAANPDWQARITAVHPDGDVELDESEVADFVIVPCRRCGGMLKPDVVFFGETVPASRVASSFALVESARSLLVLGSSLTVMSGYRFVVRAARCGLPVGIVNQGITRGHAHAEVSVDAPLGVVLTAVTRQLGVVPAGVPAS